MSRVDAGPLIKALDGRHWGCIDFISDLHLQPSEPRTAQAFEAYLSNTPAQALFVLGDLFEVWIGDDVLHDPASSFERRCVAALADVSKRLALFWLPGNRDFLTGSDFVEAIGGQTLDECCTLKTNAELCLLCHGDALCLQDHEYMAFRRQVRSEAWQREFLSQPLPQRLATARALRAQSRSRQQSMNSPVDVDQAQALRFLHEYSATRLIHGHTHQPADHPMGPGLTRSVLSDWCLDSAPQRAQVLRWQTSPSPVWCRVDLSGLSAKTL